MGEVGRDAARLVVALREKGLRIAVAESCTAGMVGAVLTDEPGASDVFAGGVIAYADHLKVRLLGVEAEVMASHGAVSKRSVEQMAEGVRRTALADMGVAISGIAGPAGGTAEKPVGTVWVSVADAGGTVAECHLFKGGRREVREASRAAVLGLTLRRLAQSCTSDCND